MNEDHPVDVLVIGAGQAGLAVCYYLRRAGLTPGNEYLVLDAQQQPGGAWQHVTADRVHRAHAIIEQVHADLKNAALAHLPSGKFTANAAWLVLAVMAFNLTRAVATLAGPRLTKATTATVRRTLITVPARVATSARRLRPHLPKA